MHKYLVPAHKNRKRASGEKEAGSSESVTKRLYVHVFRSPEVRSKKECAFNRRLFEMKGILESGAELKDGARLWAERYMSVSCQGRGGRPKVSFNNEAVREARKYFGYFALAKNQAMDTFEALRDYRLRERIEEHFGLDKRGFDGRRPGSGIRTPLGGGSSSSSWGWDISVGSCARWRRLKRGLRRNPNR